MPGCTPFSFECKKVNEKIKNNSGSVGLGYGTGIISNTRDGSETGSDSETSWLLFDGHGDWNGVGGEVPLSGVTAWEGISYDSNS